MKNGSENKPHTLFLLSVTAQQRAKADLVASGSDKNMTTYLPSSFFLESAGAKLLSGVYVCVCEECVYSVPAVKNSIVSLCSPMLMWLGSVGADVALVVFEEHGSFVCKSDGAAECSFNFAFIFFKKTLRNSRLCQKADCVYPCTKTHRCAWYETPTDLTKPYLDTLDD